MTTLITDDFGDACNIAMYEDGGYQSNYCFTHDTGWIGFAQDCPGKQNEEL